MEQHGKTMCVYPDEAIMMFPGLNRLRKRFAIVDIMGEITD